MATGNNTSSSLPNSLPYVIQAARSVREYTNVALRTCDVQRLPEGEGLTYNEIAIQKMQDAQSITETTVLENPQQYEEALLQITPTMIGHHIVITDKMKRRVSKNVLAQMGQGGAHSMARKKEKDYLAQLDAAPTSLGGSGTTLNSGYISAAVRRIRSNTTEWSADSPIFATLHGHQIHDIQVELATIGTYPLPKGMTEDVFKEGWQGSSYGATVFESGNIPIDGSSDSKGGVHSREGIILVEGMNLKTYEERNNKLGGGAIEILMYDEYAYGFRASGIWVYEIYSNTTAPSS